MRRGLDLSHGRCWAGLRDAYRNLCADVEAKCCEKLTKVAAMGFSAMMHGYLPLDAQGSPWPPSAPGATP